MLQHNNVVMLKHNLRPPIRSALNRGGRSPPYEIPPTAQLSVFPMLLLAQQPIHAADLWLMILEWTILCGSLFVWIYSCSRFLCGRPVLPAYQPRKFTPWTGLDLLLILFFYLFVIFAIQFGVFCTEKATGRQIIDREDDRPAAEQKHIEKTTMHPAAQLLKDKNPLLLVFVFVVVAVVAPIAEEFFYRLLLIGWLESSEHRWRRKLRSLLGVLPRGMLPIVLSSLLFASMHNWKESPEVERNILIFNLGMTGLIYIFTLAFAFCWLRWQTGATAKDFGWDAKRFWGDIVTGMTAFLAVALPIYALHIDLAYYILPQKYAPDPISLFFFALVLGLLYYRTHRIVPSIVVHALLNASSLAMAWSSL
jgi:membrane protease YdiL (CAAX protease family)